MNNEKYKTPFSKTVNDFAVKLDMATIAHDYDELERLLVDIEKQIEKENPASQSRLYYSIGTVYNDFAKVRGISVDESFRKRLYCFRKSIMLIETAEYANEIYSPYVNGFKISLYTNYANTLHHCGRMIEAIAQYKKVLNLHPSFGMALGNLGKTYMDYAIMEFDPSHKDYFHHFAYSLLKKALECKDPNTYPEAKDRFKSAMEGYAKDYVEKVLEQKLSIPQFTYADPKELTYREWAVENVLFLNTLNDLPVSELCFAADVLQLPNIVVSINAKPIFHGMFNQIKQEYVYARYLYYCSLENKNEPHYADKETHLINFADYPQYGMRIEQLKTAFKTLYGLLDKIAYFINSYFELGIKERHVSFSRIWLKEYGYKFKNTLNHQENFALASLYWISRDFYDSFEDSPNPQLKRISNIRNALEHKYVKVTASWFSDDTDDTIDDLAFYVSEIELSELTLNLLHIVREAIICLALCVNIEEKKRKETIGDNVILPISLWEYNDEWKL